MISMTEAVRGAPKLVRLPDRSIDIASALISFHVCTLVTFIMIGTNDQYLHWFMIPVTVAGIIIGIDAVDWFRRRLDIFDPVGILGLLGVHFFFLAPILHVYWDSWMRWVVPPDDWRPWVGLMSILNVMGLIVYRLTRSLIFRISKPKLKQAVWWIDEQRFPIVLALALMVTAALQVQVYRQSGGILGYINIYETAIETTNAGGGFEGMGWIFMISESFPILALMAYAFYARKRPTARTWGMLLLVLLAFFVLKILFGGLRGSRSNTIWGLFWGLGIIHFWIRRVPQRLIYIGIVFLVGFVYIYGFYKAGGLDAISQLTSSGSTAELQEETGRSLEGAVLGDLGRTDVQAFVLYRLMRPDSDYQYSFGRTYLGAAAILIPKSVWPDRPIHKIKEGTEVLYGRGSYVPGVNVSSRVYGLSGETMLNFGPFVVPLAFAVLGLAVGRVRYWLSTWEPYDVRMFFVPFLVNLCFVLLVSDSDNILFFIIKNGAVPMFVVWLTVRITAKVTDPAAEIDAAVLQRKPALN